MKRAYSALEVKGLEDEQRVISGLATSPVPDREGDVIDPFGAKYAKSIPLFLYHDSRLAVGTVKLGKPTAEGIPFEATIPKVSEPGNLQRRVDEAWQMVKHKLIAAVSIGFRAVEDKTERLKSGGLKYIESEILELSLVPIPMQSLATINSIKAFDANSRAALGLTRSDIERTDDPPGDSGNTKAQPAMSGLFVAPKGNRTVKTIQESIAAYEATRSATAAQIAAIVNKSLESGESLDAADKLKRKELADEIREIDDQILMLKDSEQIMVAHAVPVTKAVGTQAAAESRAGISTVKERKLEKGVGFARFAGALAHTKGNYRDAMDFVSYRFPDQPQLKDIYKMFANHDYETLTKAAVAVGTTTGTTWAAPLVQYTQMAEEFIDFLRPQTIVGRIPNLRKVPFNIAVPRLTAGGAAYWVGEANPKPMTSFALDQVTLRWTKLASICAISQELARFSAPNAETMVRDQLAAAVIQQMDADFVNPANAGVTNVKPASITNGVTGITSSGSTSANVNTDIGAIFAAFIAANLAPTNAVWIMSPMNALGLSLKKDSLGQRTFPDVGMTGGDFNGMPVVVSNGVGNIVILADAANILIADDGQVAVDSSTEASLQMSDAPDSPVAATTVLVSLWQHNLIGIRAERYVNWTKAYPAAVQYLSGVNWGA